MNQRPLQIFFARRRRGEVQMHTVFWPGCTALGCGDRVAPLPYNVFLYAGVGRA
jgi:hypothetical protein